MSYYKDRAGLASDIYRIITSHRVDIYDQFGQWLFPVYAESGGLSCKLILYVKKKGQRWPKDLGRAGNSKVLAFEFDYTHSDSLVLNQFKDAVTEYLKL